MPKGLKNSNSNKSFVAKVKAKLEKQKSLLETEIFRLKGDDPYLQEDRPVVTSEPGQAAMEYEGHERIEIVRDNLKRALHQVKKALFAIVRRKYGKCERCGKLIEKARLEVVPEATLCLSCEREIEKSRGQQI